VELVQFQIEVSTGEEERNLFSTEQPVLASQIDSSSVMPPGLYRVVNGEVYRIVGGPAPVRSGS
jgi:hypothetical protein